MMKDIRTEEQTMFAKVCLAIVEYDRVTRDGGASGSWSEFLKNANEDPAGICYEIADTVIELFPDYAIYQNEDADEDMMRFSFELGQIWLKYVSELGGE
jgi:hypothetical protein